MADSRQDRIQALRDELADLEREEEEHAQRAVEEVADEVEEHAEAVNAETEAAATAAQEAAESAAENQEHREEEVASTVEGTAERHGLDPDDLARRTADELERRGHVVHRASEETVESVAEHAPAVAGVPEADPIRPQAEHWFTRKRPLRVGRRK